MIKIDQYEITPEYFPDGTLKINLSEELQLLINKMFFEERYLKIEWFFENNEEQIVLYNIVKMIREEYPSLALHLFMPYVPNARMDRIEISGECPTLKYFCEFINWLNFENVEFYDPHSNVTSALLNNSGNISPTYIKVNYLKEFLDIDVLFYPDEGAVKKYSSMLEHPYVFGIKNRDWKTGEIKGLSILGDLPEKKDFNVLIVDDISSYGGTFLHSAKKLKEFGAGKIYLYVTHCENSILKGDLINSGLIEKIYTTDSIYTGEHPLIEILRKDRQ